MEIMAVLFMVVAGGMLAILVMVAAAIARREQNGTAGPPPQRDSIAASILVNVAAAGGLSFDEAARRVRRGAGVAAPLTTGIDLANWAEQFAMLSTPQQRRWLLETAVQLVAGESPIPMRQYAALLDLSFGLGFQTDALARLRETYGFDYIDHARDARPVGADRAGGGAPLFERLPRSRADLLGVLGISGTPSRQEIGVAYRKLVAQHHPDRFHGASAEEQNAAAGRFIEITRAYEELLRSESTS